MSARAIGQSRVTRDYLKSIKQEDVSLPEGPVLLNPTSLLNAFHREVIEKKPEEFKISCLKDIQALFQTDDKPFYAGYGNKINVSFNILFLHSILFKYAKDVMFYLGCLVLSSYRYTNIKNIYYKPQGRIET